MSDILFSIIQEKVYKAKEIQEISSAGGKTIDWIFDFKNQGLSKSFLREYARCFWDAFQDRSAGRLQIGGMETGALSLIAGISLSAPAGTDVAGFYIRKSRKKSDLANLVEGEIVPDAPIILIDDILNSGATLRKEIHILEERGLYVAAIFVCLRFRELSYYQDLLDKGIRILSIFELDDFKSVLPVRNLVTKTEPRPYERYAPAYRVRVTDKPNLYLVVPKSAPLLVGEHVYVGADDGSFHCLRAEDGLTVWTYRVLFGDAGKRILSSPAVFEDRVLFGAYDGNVYCLNRFTGKRAWVFTDADWVGSSPCVDTDAGIVYIGLEFGPIKKRGGVVAIDIRSGRVRWKNYDMAGLVHASPAYDKRNNLVVCGCNDHCLYAFAADTGRSIWKFQTRGEVKYGAIFDDERDLVIFGSMDGGLYALQSKDGMLYHRFEARFGFYSTPAMEGDIVIIGSLDKRVYGFNMETKETGWVFETAGRVFASPIMDGQSVFIGSNDGRLYELDSHTGRALSILQLDERIVNRIQVGRTTDGKKILYVPTQACELYRMNEK